MNLFSKLFKSSGAKNKTAPLEEAVLIHLNGRDLPEEIYKKFDLMGLEDELAEAIDSQGLGKLDGNKTGPGETIIFLYGPNADALYAGIEPILKKHSLCQLSRAIVRKGPPGSAQREIRT